MKYNNKNKLNKKSKRKMKIKKSKRKMKKSIKKLKRNSFGLNLNIFSSSDTYEYPVPYLNKTNIELGLVNINKKTGSAYTDKNALVIVDPQNDFVNDKNAVNDMINIINMIDNNGDQISDIFITLDTHNRFGITNPMFWISKTREHPEPFTIITKNDVLNGTWTPIRYEFYDQALEYIDKLEQYKRHPLQIWNEHCIIGTYGNLVYSPLAEALERWERKFIKAVHYIPKGYDTLRDQFSAICSEDHVINNTKIITDLTNNFTRILVCGEVLQICVRNTLEDLLKSIKGLPIILLKDASTVELKGYSSDFIKDFAKIYRNFSLLNTTEVFK